MNTLPIDSSVIKWWCRINQESWHRPTPLIAILKEDNMDKQRLMLKAVHSFISEIVMEKVEFVVKKRVAEVLSDRLVEMIRHLVNTGIERELQHRNITLTPYPDPCPRNAFKDWSSIEDDMLCEEIRNAMLKIAENHGRSHHAIYCRVRDKVFEK